MIDPLWTLNPEFCVAFLLNTIQQPWPDSIVGLEVVRGVILPLPLIMVEKNTKCLFLLLEVERGGFCDGL